MFIFETFKNIYSNKYNTVLLLLLLFTHFAIFNALKIWIKNGK